MSCFEEQSPTKVFRCLSEFILKVAEQERENWACFRFALFQKMHSPDCYELNKESNDEIFQALISRATSLVDIVCGTPCALAEFADHSSWVPDLIVTDEAPRLSETMSLLLPAKWPHAAGLFIGDTNQLQPLALCKAQRDFKPVFGLQREISLFKRMENMYRLTFILRRNYRARLDAVQWAQKDLYANQMSIVYQDHTPATEAFTEWTFKVFGVRSTTVMIRPSGSSEAKVGHAFVNQANVNFVTQLVVQLYRQAELVNADDAQKNMTTTDEKNKVRVRRASILILTPYSTQKSSYQSTLQQMRNSEVPKALVKVCTVDEATNSEADVVIVDCVRTTDMGPINDIHCLSVMMTRARIGTILVGTTSKIAFAPPFKELVEYMQDRKSIIDQPKQCIKTRWNNMCDNCIQPGHTASICTFKPKCKTCNGDTHATRHCPKSWEDAIWLHADEPVKADDGINRDCFADNSAHVNVGKRVKKKSTRARFLRMSFRTRGSGREGDGGDGGTSRAD
ncbi:hypothetical protein NM208_g11809 [Fusarium decemcellulare]|uniref:Uncharacterized protein n=1 Tax=Fusarium decemcellulare TaxID=57161 RepID=A0ACC1RRI2_9HYPO|nr:hypothetical protein NM208_g11809 [Fusarium decemcellulare]